jgi:uncharacterized membrane protein YccC
MSQQIDQPFDSIESAYDFVRILCSAVADAKRDLEGDIQRESSSKSSRRLDALRLAFYNVDKLELHVNRSRRILNDLRSLRRLLFEERAASKPALNNTAVESNTDEALIAEIPAGSLAAELSSQAPRPRGKNGSVVAA